MAIFAGIVLSMLLKGAVYGAKAAPASREPQSGKTYYVSDAGSDGNSGSRQRPWRSIAHALDVACDPGNTVYVRAGTWSEEILIGGPAGVGRGGAPGNYFRLAAFPNEEVVMTGRIVLSSAFQGARGGDHVVVEGFHMVGWRGTIGAGGDDDIIRNNLFTGAYRIYAGAINVDGNFCVVDNNTLNLTYTGSPNDHGIYVLAGNDFLARNNVVRRNRVSGFSGYGIHVYDEYKEKGDAQRHIANILIEDNYIEGSQMRAGILIGTGGGGHVTIDNVVIRNNVIVNNPEGGILVGCTKSPEAPSDAVRNIYILNNTIYGVTRSEAAGVDLSQVTAGRHDLENVVIANNIIDTRTAGARHINNGAKLPERYLTVSHNLYWPAPTNNYRAVDAGPATGNPQFVDAAARDFHLRPGSPAIDAGSSEALVPRDMDGVPRPQGRRHDIGAYEYRQ